MLGFILSVGRKRKQSLLHRHHFFVEKLTAAGYIYVGMDHFAVPDDELSVALGAGNAVGGYVVTERMLEMFKSSKPASGPATGKKH